MLPAEVLSQVFLHLDPHTLYTSIRALNSHWRTAVEQELLPHHFRHDNWKVGLRVTHRRRITPLTPVSPQETDDEEAIRERLSSALATPGTLDDEVHVHVKKDHTPAGQISHVIPLIFTGYDRTDTTLGFSTGPTWQALFEHLDDQDRNERLDYDFAILWRFPGDGKEDGESSDGWGEPDPENNWLSRFYCSNHDTSTISDPSSGAETPITLLSTPLARRTRQVLDDDAQTAATTCTCHSKPMIWSDAGNEYVSLSLALGIEFFVRRSARANLLMRKLEAEARRADEADAQEILSADSTLNAGGDEDATSPRRTTAASSASGRSTPSLGVSPTPSRISGTAQRARELTPLEQRLSRCFKDGAKAQPLTFGANTPSSRPGTPRSGRGSTPRRSRNALLAAAARNSASGFSTPLNGSSTPVNATALSSALSTNSTSTPRGSNGRGTPRARFSARLLLGADASSHSFRSARMGSECEKCGLPRFERAEGRTLEEERWRGRHAMGSAGAWLNNEEIAASTTDAAGWKKAPPTHESSGEQLPSKAIPGALLDMWGINTARQATLASGADPTSHAPEVFRWQWSR